MKWITDFGFSQSITISKNFFGATILLERHSKDAVSRWNGLCRKGVGNETRN